MDEGWAEAGDQSMEAAGEAGEQMQTEDNSGAPANMDGEPANDNSWNKDSGQNNSWQGGQDDNSWKRDDNNSWKKDDDNSWQDNSRWGNRNDKWQDRDRWNNRGRKGGNTWKPGDWECPNCNQNVFARNSSCNKCGTERPDSGGGSEGGHKKDWDDKGDWKTETRERRERVIEDEIELKLEKEKVIRCIGGKGMVIRQMQRESGAFIRCDPDADEPNIKVHGTIEQVDRARSMLQDMIASEGKPIPGNWEDEMFRKCSKEETAKIIGSKGVNIQYIEKKSWAKLQITEEEGNPIVMVRVTGSHDAVDTALGMMSDAINFTGEWAPRDRGYDRGQKRKHYDANAEPECTEVLHFEAFVSGNIIGKSGVNIKKIREESGVDIKCEKMESEDKCEVTLKGDTDQVETAKKLVHEYVEIARSKFKPREGLPFEVLEFPKRSASNIIGPRGEHIKEVRAKTGADVQVKDNDYYNCNVTIVGQPEQIENAKVLVIELARCRPNNEPAAPPPPPGPAPVAPPPPPQQPSLQDQMEIRQAQLKARREFEEQKRAKQEAEKAAGKGSQGKDASKGGAPAVMDGNPNGDTWNNGTGDSPEALGSASELMGFALAKGAAPPPKQALQTAPPKQALQKASMPKQNPKIPGAVNSEPKTVMPVKGKGKKGKFAFSQPEPELAGGDSWDNREEQQEDAETDTSERQQPKQQPKQQPPAKTGPAKVAATLGPPKTKAPVVLSAKVTATAGPPKVSATMGPPKAAPQKVPPRRPIGPGHPSFNQAGASDDTWEAEVSEEADSGTADDWQFGKGGGKSSTGGCLAGKGTSQPIKGASLPGKGNKGDSPVGKGKTQLGKGNVQLGSLDWQSGEDDWQSGNAGMDWTSTGDEWSGSGPGVAQSEPQLTSEWSAQDEPMQEQTAGLGQDFEAWPEIPQQKPTLSWLQEEQQPAQQASTLSWLQPQQPALQQPALQQRPQLSWLQEDPQVEQQPAMAVETEQQFGADVADSWGGWGF